MCHLQDPSFQLCLCVCPKNPLGISRKCCRTIGIPTSFGSMIFLKKVRPCFHCFLPLVEKLQLPWCSNPTFAGRITDSCTWRETRLRSCWANGVTRLLWSPVDNSYGNPMGRLHIYLHGLMFMVNVMNVGNYIYIHIYQSHGSFGIRKGFFATAPSHRKVCFLAMMLNATCAQLTDVWVDGQLESGWSQAGLRFEGKCWTSLSLVESIWMDSPISPANAMAYDEPLEKQVSIETSNQAMRSKTWKYKLPGF